MILLPPLAETIYGQKKNSLFSPDFKALMFFFLYGQATIHEPTLSIFLFFLSFCKTEIEKRLLRVLQKKKSEN